MNPEDAHYIHGTRPEEQQRLSVLNRLLNEASLRQMRVQAGGELPDSEIAAGIAALKSWSKRPEAALWYATCWAEAHRP